MEAVGAVFPGVYFSNALAGFGKHKFVAAPPSAEAAAMGTVAAEDVADELAKQRAGS